MKLIPYGKQSICKNDINAVLDVLKSDWLTQGPKLPEFEKKISKYCNVSFTVATNSATSALHLACMALSVGPSDIVWTSPNSFVATSNCALYCGAKIDFVDIDPLTYNISIKKLKEKLKLCEIKGNLPKVLIPVHFAGLPCDMKEIHKLSKKYNFSVIEDASHAIGSLYLNNKIGNCKYSDITVFSFHPVKIITSAEGGAAVTNNNELDNKMRILRSHGITKDQEKFHYPTNKPWQYEQHLLGFNYRITELQAALGITQLNKIDKFIRKRNEIAKIYDNELANLNIQLPYINKNCLSSYHLYVINLNETENTHKNIFQALRSFGINVNLHYTPIHLQPFYKNLGFKEGDYVVSENYAKRAISLPIFPKLKKIEQKFIIKKLKKCIQEIRK